MNNPFHQIMVCPESMDNVLDAINAGLLAVLYTEGKKYIVPVNGAELDLCNFPFTEESLNGREYEFLSIN